MKYKKLSVTVKADYSSYYVDENGDKYPNLDIKFYFDDKEIENIESVEWISGESKKVKVTMTFDEIDSPTPVNQPIKEE